MSDKAETAIHAIFKTEPPDYMMPKLRAIYAAGQADERRKVRPYLTHADGCATEPPNPKPCDCGYRALLGAES